MSLPEPPNNFSTPPSPEKSGRKRPVSERQIQANRRNALRSTGPKTTRGKRAVSRNAITHGLLAREVVITAGDGEERLKEFRALVESLYEHYEPVGPVEGMFVERIAVCWWKLGRAVRAENGEIRKRLDTLKIDRALRKSNQANLDVARSEIDGSLYDAKNRTDQNVSTADRWSAMQVTQTNLRGHRSGLESLSALLEIAKSKIAIDGYMSEKIRKKIFLEFCFCDYWFAFTCLHAGPPEAKKEGVPSEKGGEKQIETKSADLVALIERQLEKIGMFKEYALVREDLELDAEARSFSLPSVDATDKLLRYESHLDRQLYRAMDQLERLQRQRRGENVPPPLNVNLGRRT